MGYGIMRVQKIKGASGGFGAYMHNERKSEKSNSNPDIDFDKSDLNFSFGEYDDKLTYNQRAEKRIAEGYTGTRAIRKDAVKMVEVLIAPSDENLTGEQQHEFLKKGYQWLCDEFGKENIIADRVHLDEKNPHLHGLVVPLTEEGRLSCKKVIGGRQQLQQMQDRFFEQVSKPFGLERGEKVDLENNEKPIKKHIPQLEYKKKTIASLDKQITEKNNDLSMAEVKVNYANRKRKRTEELINKLNEIADNKQEEIKSLDIKRSDAQKSLLALQVDLSNLEQNKIDSKASYDAICKDLTDAYSLFKEIDEKNDKLIEEHNSLVEKYNNLLENPPEIKNIDYKEDYEALINGINELSDEEWNTFCNLELSDEAWNVLANEFPALQNQGIELT